MKSFRIADDEAISDDNVRDAILKPSLGKRTRKDVAKVLDNLEESIKEIQRIEQMTIQGKYHLPKHKSCTINEKGPHKQREILKPNYMPEQIMHHIAVKAIKDAVMHGMYIYVLGSVPGRGAHLGKKVIERWIREDPENTRIIGKMDIRHFFQSVDHEILRKWIHKKIRPGEIRDLLEIIMDASDMGLPLGFYTSQWFANFLLQPLDHYIKEELHIKYMTRYMDDIVIFGSNKKQIHYAVSKIQEYLRDELNLEMKKNWQVFRFEYEQEEAAIMCRTLKELYALDAALTSAKIKHKCKMSHGKRKIYITMNLMARKEKQIMGMLSEFRGTYDVEIMLHGRALDYMGFEFHRNRTILRKSIMINATRKATQISKSEKVCWCNAASFLSMMGWVTRTDSYNMFCERIQPKVSVKKMKQIVSKHQRRVNNADHMENHTGNSERKATCD